MKTNRIITSVKEVRNIADQLNNKIIESNDLLKQYEFICDTINQEVEKNIFTD